MANYILADNQELTSYALESILLKDSENRIRRASDKAGLIELLKENEHSVVVLDYALFDIPDEDSLLIISERFAMATWVLLCDDLTEKFMRKMTYSSHVFSIVFKDSSLKSIRDALQYAAQGNRYVCQRATEIILSQQHEREELVALTATETEIVKSIALGKTTKEIANERFLSIHTINTHRKNIFRKLGVNTAHEVIKYAFRAGLVNPSEFYI